MIHVQKSAHQFDMGGPAGLYCAPSCHWIGDMSGDVAEMTSGW